MAHYAINGLVIHLPLNRVFSTELRQFPIYSSYRGPGTIAGPAA